VTKSNHRAGKNKIPNTNPKSSTLVTASDSKPGMDTYSASPYPLLDGKNGADTPGAFFFRRKDSKDTNMKPVSPNNQSQQPRSSSSCYEPSIAQSDATTLVPDNNQRIGASAVCPTTPPHGSRGTSWSSYRDLPSGHPVFEYSDEVRAELYERGVGECAEQCLSPLKNSFAS